MIKIFKKNDIAYINVNNGILDVVFCSFGASVFRLKYNDEDMILALNRTDAFCHSLQYFSKTLGPVAGRVENSPFAYKKGLLLHGDEDALSYKNFNYEIDEKEDVTVTFRVGVNSKVFTTPYRFEIKYVVSKNKLHIYFEGEGKDDALINLSNHMYFRLPSSSLVDQHLYINASKVFKYRDDLLPIGIEEVKPYLDFRKEALIGEKFKDIALNCLNNTLDHTYIFDSKEGVKVSLRDSKYIIKVFTNCSSCNFYIDDTDSKVDFFNKLESNRVRGIAIEPQRNLLDEEEVIIKKGDKYLNYITYEFSLV